MIINNRNIPSKIKELNDRIKENLLLEELLNAFTLSNEIDDRIPLKMKKKILCYRKKYDKSNSKKDKIAQEFEEYRNEQVYKYKKSTANCRAEIRRLQNLHEWNNLDKAEKIQRDTDLSFYRANILPYWLCFSIILLDIVYLDKMLAIMERNFWVGIFIIVNIALLLFLFTTAIKIKNYKKLFCYFICAFGLYCIARITFVITYILQVPLSSEELNVKFWIYGTNIYCAVVSFYIGISSFVKIVRKEAYIKNNKITFKQMSK